MTAADYPAVRCLWEESEGVGLSATDSHASIERFLARNPGFSCVAVEEGDIVGVLLCGHDGRRGYIHHLAVHPQQRRRGIGRRLVDRALGELTRAGIDKCHIFVFKDNGAAIAFWQRIGWTDRVELEVLSRAVRGTRVNESRDT
jgi:putative acetyltransferase